MQEVIVFAVGKCEMAVKAIQVTEIIRAVAITTLPGIQAPLLGFINYRGNSVAVVWSGYLLGLEPPEPNTTQAMLILNITSQAKTSQICLLVDEVLSFVAPDQIEIVSKLTNGGFQSPYVEEVAKIEQNLLPIVRVDSLLKPQETNVMSLQFAANKTC